MKSGKHESEVTILGFYKDHGECRMEDGFEVTGNRRLTLVIR